MSTLSALSSATQYALQGINQGMSNLQRDAQTVAQNGVSVGNDAGTNALIDAKTQQLDVQASATALSIADKTLGTLLDVTA